MFSWVVELITQLSIEFSLFDPKVLSKYVMPYNWKNNGKIMEK
jgi:hypothetical protein